MFSIAIDGPAAAGKTTQAKLLAKELGFLYVDTGAMYRAFAVHKLWLEKEAGQKVDIETALHTFDLDISHEKDGSQRISIFGKDITASLRTPEVSMAASETSAHPSVRKALLSLQRKFADCNNVVMEGRDIGSVVLPDATLKVFLTASPEIRALRRFNELAAKDTNTTLDAVRKDMETRDYNDSHREIAPLQQTPDAILVDDSSLTIQQTTQKLLKVWNEVLSSKGLLHAD